MVDEQEHDHVLDHISKMEAGICQFLISASLADHLGDIRDAEEYLWEALGFDRSALRHEMYESDDWDNTFRPTRRLLIKGGFFYLLPDYAQEEHDDDE